MTHQEIAREIVERTFEGNQLELIISGMRGLGAKIDLHTEVIFKMTITTLFSAFIESLLDIADQEQEKMFQSYLKNFSKN